MPLADDSALVYSIPKILRITPRGRQKLYVGYGFADTHGMTSSFTPGLDGWVYACHGFANTSDIKNKDVKGIKLQSGNTYRMKADGSAIEQFHLGAGQPVRAVLRPPGQPLLRRLPFAADLPAPARAGAIPASASPTTAWASRRR